MRRLGLILVILALAAPLFDVGGADIAFDVCEALPAADMLKSACLRHPGRSGPEVEGGILALLDQPPPAGSSDSSSTQEAYAK